MTEHKMTLIEDPQSGEQQLVSSVEGYPDWEVLAEDVDCPEDDHEWDKQERKWKANEDHKKKRRGKCLEKVVADLSKRVDDLEKTLGKMLQA